MSDTVTMDSPTERQTKQILVSLWSRRGLVGWRLVTAHKVGRHYEVDEKAFYGMPSCVSVFQAYRANDNASPISLTNHHILPDAQ